MKLLDQKIKADMEKCKERARVAGLQFPDNTLVLSKFYYLDGEEAFYIVESKSL